MVVFVIKQNVQLLYLVHEFLCVECAVLLFVGSHHLEELLKIVDQVILLLVLGSVGENQVSKCLTVKQHLKRRIRIANIRFIYKAKILFPIGQFVLQLLVLCGSSQLAHLRQIIGYLVSHFL